MIEEWISAEFHRLAEIISDYDEYLELQWIPPQKREDQLDKTKCYRIMDTRNNKIILYANELDSPVDILARLWGSDSAKGNVLSRVDAHNAAVKAMRLREELDIREAELDFSIFVLKNERNYWVHQGKKRDAEFNDLGSIRKIIT